MRKSPSPARRSRPAFVPLAGALAGAIALAASALPAGDVPHFSKPLEIDNEFFPFVVGGVKQYTGDSDGAGLDVLDNYLPQTRTFIVNNRPVKCRQLEEIVFEDGELHEVAQNWFAQADDGSVWYFGETVDNYVDGRIDNHDGSWLVGGPTQPTDPKETAAALVPGLFMPAEPEPGDHWKPEDLFPFVDETVTMQQEDLELEVEAGEFEDVIQVRETSRLPDTTPEKKWYGPDLGLLRVVGVNEFLELVEVQGFPRDGERED